MQCFVGSVFFFPRWICMWLSYSTSLRNSSLWREVQLQPGTAQTEEEIRPEASILLTLYSTTQSPRVCGPVPSQGPSHLDKL